MTEATQKMEEWSDTGGRQLERRQTGVQHGTETRRTKTMATKDDPNEAPDSTGPERSVAE